MNDSADNPVVVIETSAGTIQAQLWADKAPKTVDNFLRYVDEGFYDGLIFHRVIDGFMIQSGGFDANMNQKSGHEQIENEAAPELSNDCGTLAMARTSDIHSATSQFFINLADNGFLNQTSKTSQGFGYCAFANVVEGQDVVDAIGKVDTRSRGGYDDVPADAVTIKSIKRLA